MRILATILAGALVLAGRTTYAYPTLPRAGPMTPVEILGIIFVAEAGWDYPTDHALIAHMFARRARHYRHGGSRRYSWSFVSMAMAYSTGTWISKRARGRWLRGMREDCDAPPLWPHGGARWEKFYRHRCAAVMERARAYLRHPSNLPEPTCRGGVPWHFGFEQDKPKPGMVRIDCGETKNIYYTLTASRLAVITGRGR